MTDSSARLADAAVLLAVDHDAEASPVVRFATQELRRILLATTGRAVSVVDASGGRPDTIVLGQDPSLGEDPGDDVIAIDVRGGVGTITGSNERSVLIAAYRYLTELGCRFVRPGPDGEHLPPIDLDRSPVTVRERAALRHRGVCIEGAASLTNLLDLIDWLPKVGMNSYFIQFDSPHVFLRSWYERRTDPAGHVPDYPITERTEAVHRAVLAEIERRGLVHHAVGHGWTSEAIGVTATGWDAVTGANFPRELVAEVDGVRELWGGVPLNTELCYSRPEVRSAMARAVADHARAHPEIDVLHVWLSDGNANHCECDACARLRPADWYVMMLNELDQILTEEGTPTTIAFLAYHQLLWPPLAETIDAPERFVLMFAPIHRDASAPMVEPTGAELPPYEGNATRSPVRNGDFLDLLRSWRNTYPGSTFDFDYHLMWQHCFDPGQLTIARTLHADIGGMQTNGLDGLISCQSQRVFSAGGFAMTVMARTLWDTSTSFDDVIADHAAATFGPDGRVVAEHLQWLSDAVAEWGLNPRTIAQPTIEPTAVEAVRNRLARLSALVDEHGDDDHPVQAISWHHLGFHLRVWEGLCGVWEAVADRDRPAMMKRWTRLIETVWQSQDQHQAVFDAPNFCQTVDGYLNRLLPAVSK